MKKILMLLIILLGSSLFILAQVPAELLENGGFEAGHAIAPWETSSKNGNGMIIGGQGGPNTAHAGNRLCKLGGSNSEEDTLTQSFLVPMEATGEKISFYYKVKAGGNSSTAEDFLTIRFYNSIGEIVAEPTCFSNLTSASDWTLFEADLPPFGGYLLTLALVATTDKSQPTTFYLDDVSLKYSLLPGTTGSPVILFLSPRNGCIYPVPFPPIEPFPTTVSGSTTISAVGASANGISSMAIYVDGKLTAFNQGQNRIDAILRSGELAPGSHDVEGELVDSLGQTVRCPVVLSASNIIQAGDFEGNPAEYYWEKDISSPLLVTDELLGDEMTMPRSFESFARLGGSAGASQTMWQYLPIAEDAQGIMTISFYYRISTEKTITSPADIFSVQLKNLSDETITTIKTLSNLSAVDGWALCRIPLAVGTDVAQGGEYELRFACLTTRASLTTTFDIDDVSVWIPSQRLIDDPWGDKTPDPNESFSDGDNPMISGIDVHAQPPYCSGGSGLNECTHTNATITGYFPGTVSAYRVGFRVTVGGVPKYSIVYPKPSSDNSHLVITIPDSPLPSHFMPVRLLVDKPLPGGDGLRHR